MKKNILKKSINALPNGLICLKGGELASESHPFKNIVVIDDLSQWFKEEYFGEKKVVFLPMS